MRVFVLGTGSTGNCLVVDADGARVVIDAGMNPTQATRAISSHRGAGSMKPERPWAATAGSNRSAIRSSGAESAIAGAGTFGGRHPNEGAVLR